MLWKDRIDVVIGTAKYLHPIFTYGRILFRFNILLDEQYITKLLDFGCSFQKK